MTGAWEVTAIRDVAGRYMEASKVHRFLNDYSMISNIILKPMEAIEAEDFNEAIM